MNGQDKSRIVRTQDASRVLDLYRAFNEGDADLEPWQILHAYGVGAGDVAVVKRLISFIGESRFEFDPVGMVGLCLFAYDERDEHPIDVIAWPVRQRETFGSLFGAAPILGVHNLGGECCAVWSSPFVWLAFECIGVVIVDPIPASIIIAQRAPQTMFVAESIDLARKLRASRAIPAQRIEVAA